jgi:toxin ParE1/3/4
MPPRRRWRLRLGLIAERDLIKIVGWTAENFGAQQARVYRRTLLLAIRALGAGPDPPGSRARDDIVRGLRALHIARAGRRGRHFLIYRVVGEREIEIIRILHDSMDFRRHVP